MTYKTYDFTTADVRINGRGYVEGSAVVLPWSYSGFSFVFSGKNLVFTFAQFSDELPAYVRITVDGVTAKYGISDGKEVIVTPSLAEGSHTASFMRITEGMSPLYVTSLKVCGSSPSIIAKTPEKKLKIEFIGDSITCGYGIDAPSDVAVFNTYEEDCSLTYASECARILGADVSFAGASGKGIVANCNGDRSDMTLRQAFVYKNRQGGEWDHSLFVPDVVVVNAGTNDAWGGVSDDEFFDTAVTFIGEIRKKYPSAAILWAYGIMDTTKVKTIEKAVSFVKETDGNVYFLPVECMSKFADELGGAGHPSIFTSKRVGPLLADTIKNILSL